MDLQRLWASLEADKARWQAASRSSSPPRKEAKQFSAKFPDIPILEDYKAEAFPPHYWDKWPTSKLEDYKVESWVSPDLLEQVCKEVGIPTTYGLARQVLTKPLTQKFGSCILYCIGRN